MRKELFSNFNSKIKFNEETWCWEWVGSLNSNGYGQFSFLNKTYKSHRMSYMLYKGYIPNDKVIDHLCGNRLCCNPEHLEATTIKENNIRGNGGSSNFGSNRLKGKRLSIIDRFYSKLSGNPVTQCWEFNGNPDADGYGYIRYRNFTYRIHRFSYLLFQGEIPKNHVVDHLCKNRKCCNPEHLEAVSHKENMVRGDTGRNNHQTLKTHCPKGHEYTDSNTYINPKGSRECRICKSINRKADRKRNLEKYRELDRLRWTNRNT